MRTIPRTRRMTAIIACTIVAGMYSLSAAAAPDARRITHRADNAVAQTGYAIGFYAISTGGNAMSNSCYHLRGTLGQTAPGYSSGDIYALIAGYWQFLPPSNPDEIFFNSFEDC